MKSYSYLIIVISIIIFSSFSRQEITLEKTWVLESYNSNNHTMTYKQETEFSEDKRGIQFLPNGKLKIKQAGGWCGTVSPGERINWVILDGTWTISSNSDIVLNYSYLRNNTEKLKIIELSKNKLIVKNSNR